MPTIKIKLGDDDILYSREMRSNSLWRDDLPATREDRSGRYTVNMLPFMDQNIFNSLQYNIRYLPTQISPRGLGSLIN